MSSPIMQAIKQISEEKDIPYESVIETIEAALAAAYRKDFGNRMQNIKVKFEPETGEFDVFDVKTVVDDQELPTEEELAEMERLEIETARAARRRPAFVAPAPPPAPVEGEEPVKKFNPKTEIMITEAKASLKKDVEIGEEIRTKLEVPSAFGYMAAQTAKQVITQKLREAERNKVFSEFKGREHELVNATVQRYEGRHILIDLGRTSGVMPPEEQVPGEHYNPGDRIKVMINDVRLTSRGPEVVVSRTHPEIVRKMFAAEIPEVASGVVEVKAIAREAGSRSKVAVQSHQENVDPIGACIGQRGTRIQTVISELGGEKVDVIQYDDDPARFISHALSPAKIVEVALDEDNRIAEVIVADEELSKAIGKAGQNVRLASKLTGWRINIKPLSEVSGTVIVPEGADLSPEALAKGEGADSPRDPSPDTVPHSSGLSPVAPVGAKGEGATGEALAKGEAPAVEEEKEGKKEESTEAVVSDEPVEAASDDAAEKVEKE